MTTSLDERVTPHGVCVLPPDAPEDAWHATRSTGIGSSDAAAILGLSPWKSPYALWMEKTGRAVDDDERRVMTWGKRLEAGIAEGFQAESGLTVLPSPGTVAHYEHRWLLANVDRLVADSPTAVPTAVLECKNVDRSKAKEWDAATGLVPPGYLVQILHQLAATGYGEAWAAGLVGGNNLVHVHVQRDDALIAALLEREAEFWDLVLNDTEPAWDSSPLSASAVKAFYREAVEGSVVTLDPDEAEAIRYELVAAKAELAAANAAQKAAKERVDVANGNLLRLMGDAETALVPTGFGVAPFASAKTVRVPERIQRGYAYRNVRLTWAD